MGSSPTTANESPQRKRKMHRPSCGYKGYRVGEGASIQSVADVAEFRTHFVDQRRPAKLDMPALIDTHPLRLSNIVRTLDYHEPLQVERKAQHGFGLGNPRLKMTLAQIVAALEGGDDSLYLTTQYEENEGDESEGDDGDDGDDGDESEGETPERGLEQGLDSVDQENGDSPNDVEGNGQKIDQALHKNPAEAAFFPESAESDFEADFSDLHDDYEETDETARVRTLFQPPLTNLARTTSPAFPIIPAPFKGLWTQQINLWMGASCAQPAAPDLLKPSLASLGKYVPRGNSSGLHHDHADNLYLLVQGRKRFTLLSPENAEALATVGDVRQVYANGLIDYHVNENAPMWRPMREDGAIRAEWAQWMLEKGDFSELSEQALRDLVDKEPQYVGPHVPLDPPSFSRIPPVLLHLDEVAPGHRAALEEFAQAHFPGLLSLKKMEVWLEPGDLLYIPVGWFHEVTSFGDTAEDAHIAVNWWFVPPAGPLSAPYEDDYWKDDFALTMDAVDEFRK